MRINIKKTIIASVIALCIATTSGIVMPEKSLCRVEASKTKSKVKYKLEKGTLTIYGKGKMPNTMAFVSNSKIKKVIIKEGVTSICKRAFKGCINLKEVEIADTVNFVRKEAFLDTSIEEIEIPESVKKIGKDALMTESLKKVTMPGDFKIMKVQFDDYHIKKPVVGPNVKTVVFNTNVKKNNLKYIQAENYEIMENDPNFKSIDGMVYSKDGKELERVPVLKKEAVVAEGCEKVDFASFNYEVNGGMGCKIENLVVPSTVNKIIYKEIDVLNLKIIALNTNKIESQVVEDIFTCLSGQEKFDVIGSVAACSDTYPELKEKFVPNEGFTISNGMLRKYVGYDKKVVIPEDVTVIGWDAFRNNTIIEEVVMHEGVTSIGARAFENCSNLEKLTLYDNVSYIGEYAFADTDIKEITVPGKLSSASRGFAGMNIEKVSFSENNTVIYREMFEGCDRLESIEIPKNIIEIQDNAFGRCDNLKDVIVKGDIGTISNNTFVYCTSLEKVECDVKVKHVGDYAFYGCKKLKTTTGFDEIISVGNNAYNGCLSLKIELSDNIETIGDYAFADTMWSKVTLPESVETIGWYAFDYSDAEAKRKVRTIISECDYDVLTSNELCRSVKIKLTSDIKEWKVVGMTPDYCFYRDYLELKGAVWKEIVGVTGYQVIIKDKKSNKIVVNTKVKTGNYKISKKVPRDVEYEVRVRPYKIVNGKNVYGKWARERI